MKTLLTTILCSSFVVTGATAQPHAEASSPVQARRVYLVATAVEPELEALAGRVAGAARVSLRGHEHVHWQDADYHFLGYDENTQAELTQARASYTLGQSAYLDLRFADAERELAAAVESFEAATAGLEDSTELGFALLYLGAAQFYSGDERAARRTFSRLHIQMPHIAPNPSEFPPEVVAQYEEARGRRSSVALEVLCETRGAMVYVDFVPRGIAPVRLDLPAGSHHLRVIAPGTTPYIENVALRNRRPTSVTAMLLPNPGYESLGDGVAALAGHELRHGDGAVAEVGRLLEVDIFGVIRVSYGENAETIKIEMVLFDTASGTRLLRGEALVPRQLGTLESSVQTAVRRAVDAVLDPAAVPEENGGQLSLTVAPTTPRPVEDRGVVGKWWFWTIIGGVAVAGITTAVIFATRPADSELGSDPSGQVVFEF